MAKKQDAFFFDNFIQCADHAGRAAKILDSTMHSFNPKELKTMLDVIHREEHGADMKKHDLLNALIKAFITPIEREDIMLLSRNIDDLVDKIEDVLLRIYCNNILVIREDALSMTGVLLECCDEVKVMLEEFSHFKTSKTLHSHIVKINTLEETADKMYTDCLRNLHTTCTDFKEVFAWHEVYTYLEKCVDACEHIADAVEQAVMNNT